MTFDQAPLFNSGPKVLHFRRFFSNLSETFIYDPIQEMRNQGVDTSVLCAVRLHGKKRPFDTHYLLRAPQIFQSAGLVGRIFSSPLGRVELDKYLWPLMRRQFIKAVKKIRPDIILAHFGTDGCLIRPVAKKLRIPLAVTFYGYDVSRLVKLSWDVWEDRYAQLFDEAVLLVGISSYICKRIEALGADPAKIRRIHLGTRMERFSYRDPAGDYTGGEVRCIHVGRLTAKKAPLHLLRAFQQACKRLENTLPLHLDIVGNGEMEREVREEVNRLGLQSQVTLHGALPHEEVARLLQRSHIYTQHCMVAPNGDTEGLGVSFIEASASGLPVVTTRHNGLPEVVLHGRSGLLSPEGDVDEMAANLAHLAANPELWTEYGRNGRDHVKQTFSMDGVVRQQVETLREFCVQAKVR